MTQYLLLIQTREIVPTEPKAKHSYGLVIWYAVHSTLTVTNAAISCMCLHTLYDISITIIKYM